MSADLGKLYELSNYASDVGAHAIASVVLDDPRFPLWSGSSVAGAHHYGDGGLLQHTYEVYKFSVASNDTAWPFTHNMPSKREIFLAVLFHDVGKMWDYEKIDGQWVGTGHKRNVHHISRSAIEWSKAVEKTNKCRDIYDSVLHAILAHHGRREWGSPVAPNSRLAWLLHLSDQMSARLNDCDTHDIIKKP